MFIFPFTYKDTSPHRIGHLPIQYHLNLIPSAKALFPDKVILTGSGELELIYLGDTIQPTPACAFTVSEYTLDT